MIELAKNFIQNHEELLPLVLLIMTIVYVINFFQKNDGYLKSLWKTDYDKRITSLKSNLQHLGPNNELLRSLIQHQIDNAVFSNAMRYTCNKERQQDFLKFYDLLKDSVVPVKINYLYTNTKIIDGTIHIRNTKNTNFDIYAGVTMGSLFLAISLFMTILIFFVPTDNFVNVFFFFFSYVGITFYGIFHLTASRGNKSFLKRMKTKYDGSLI